ncbi:MAG: sulfotransferase [Acidobacteria bacterium]|nr:sulfotransferase [Acidobacteriota bacterium]
MDGTGQSAFTEYLARTHDEPVYVVLGVQGSGTNLLVRLLTRIFNFSAMLDRSLVFNAAARLGRSPSPDAVAREIAHLQAHIFPSTVTRKFSKYAIRDNQLFAGLAQELDPLRIRSGADLARLIYAYRAFSRGTRLMAIKSDDIWETIGAIDEVLPNRRIILITRDFRDNLVSVTGKAFGPVEPLSAAQYVKERLKPYAEVYRRAGADAFHARFSTLVSAPRLFVDDFARHFKLTPAVDPDTVLSAIPFRQGKIEKWRALPPRQLAWCEGILYDELVEFGYTPESQRPVLPDRSVLLLTATRDAVRRVPQKVRRFVHQIRK